MSFIRISWNDRIIYLSTYSEWGPTLAYILAAILTTAPSHNANVELQNLP
jgi:hypothetical protein